MTLTNISPGACENGRSALARTALQISATRKARLQPLDQLIDVGGFVSPQNRENPLLVGNNSGRQTKMLFRAPRMQAARAERALDGCRQVGLPEHLPGSQPAQLPVLSMS